MEDKKYQIFISSTYTDLIKERDKVIETLLGIYHLPVGMEMFSAGNAEQWEIIKDTIETSDYYILILGHRYGSETEEGISYTEKEYDYALHLEKPILSFVRDRSASTTPDQRDLEEDKSKKLNLFYQKVTEKKMCDFWNNKDELASKVAIALPKAFRRDPQIGWVRGNKAVSSQTIEELATLSRENRYLTKELEVLKKKLIVRKPNFELYINKVTEDLKFTIDKLSEHYPKIDLNISLNDIPKELKGFISQKDISSYLNSLPEIEKIEKYQRDYYFYKLLSSENEKSKLSFKLCNTGTLKSKGIRVHITFPKELQVVELSKINNIREPLIDLPEHPLALAKRRKKELEKKNESTKTGNFPYGVNSLYGNTTRLNALAENIRTQSLSSRYIQKFNKEHWSSLSDNTVTLFKADLLHTLCTYFTNEYFIFPKNIGQFKIDISIISEELEKPLKFQIDAEISI